MAKKQKINISWNNKALSYLFEITSFIAEHSGEHKANQFHQEVFAFLKEKLSPFPERYPPCRFQTLKDAGCRCINFKKKYIIVYDTDGQDVRILGIAASARNPKYFDGFL